ncbi:MAG TPA: methanogen output domain 1-containing protein [Geminicoccaceae bacterium]|nr:methanogen output domain 1-containing protein [Geminicoccaceae bacterium]
MTTGSDNDLKKLAVPLDRDRFMRALIRELAGTLEDVIGLEETNGYISVVGGAIGSAIDRDYRAALQISRLDRSQVAAVLVDLERRIQGDFYVISEDDEKIVLGNRACPFGEMVQGRPSMCMMTSNLCGSIAANNLGYAKVELQEAIARGQAGCRVVVYLKPTEEALAAEGREYFPAVDLEHEAED